MAELLDTTVHDLGLLYTEQEGLCALCNFKMSLEDDAFSATAVKIDGKIRLVCRWASRLINDGYTRDDLAKIAYRLIDSCSTIFYYTDECTPMLRQQSALDIIEQRDGNIADTYKILLEITRKLWIKCWGVCFDFFVYLYTDSSQMTFSGPARPGLTILSSDPSRHFILTLKIQENDTSLVLSVHNSARPVGIFDLYHPDSIEDIYACSFSVLKEESRFLRAGDKYLEEFGPE